MGRHVTAMEKVARRGGAADDVTRVLRTAVDEDAAVAKRVARYAVRRVRRAFPAANGWSEDLVQVELKQEDLRLPTRAQPGLQLLVGAVYDMRAAFERGPMFAEFADGITQGLFQISMAVPIARHAMPDIEVWRAAYTLAANGDPAPLEMRMMEAVADPSVREAQMAELFAIARAFDVGGPY
ncbi:MAG: hypothetical protein JJ863_24520 [Deltaproteobacteria bacterium]|nr:hypothetical protein [Deltaproteobacteria bacterium]